MLKIFFLFDVCKALGQVSSLCIQFMGYSNLLPMTSITRGSGNKIEHPWHNQMTHLQTLRGQQASLSFKTDALS